MIASLKLGMDILVDREKVRINSLLGHGGMPFEKFLTQKVFASIAGVQITPDPKDTASFNKFMEMYKNGLNVERAASENFKR